MARVLKIDADALRRIFPHAPQRYIDGLLAHWDWIDRAGITASQKRLAYCLANVEHECGGFTIPNLSENINYTHARMAAVWPNRFVNAASVQDKYGTAPGWQRKAFDDIYGNRMGNRPGTSDGSRFIGRGAVQITGRDGYSQMQTRTGIPFLTTPELAAQPNNQAQIIAAFWSWKGLNSFADNSDFNGLVRRWNGGTNGMADRIAKLNGNDPVIDRLSTVEKVIPTVNQLPRVTTPRPRPRVTPEGGTAGGIGAGGAGGAAVALQQGADPTTIIGILIATVIVAGMAYFIIKKVRNR